MAEEVLANKMMGYYNGSEWLVVTVPCLPPFIAFYCQEWWDLPSGTPTAFELDNQNLFIGYIIYKPEGR
jgi:hypothetical protein